jgi:transposase
MDLLKSGKSTRKIARLVHVGQKTVCNVHRESGVTLPAVRLGRPRVLTANTERLIGRNAELGRMQTASETRQHLKGYESVDVSGNTVRRAFSRRKLHARIQRKVPMLTRENMRQRLSFAKKFESWTLENWKRVIWPGPTRPKFACLALRVDGIIGSGGMVQSNVGSSFSTNQKICRRGAFFYGVGLHDMT